MTKKSVYIFKGIIFAFGLLLYLTAFYICTGGTPKSGADSLTEHNKQFLWTNIGVVYVVFFLPLLFNEITFKNFAKQTIAIVLLWNVDVIFCIASIAMSVMVYYRKIESSTALIVEGVLIFLALLVILISLLSSDHVATVEEGEKRLLGSIEAIRSRFAILASRVKSVDGVDADVKNKIERMAEDTRYISPVESTMAIALENKIQATMDEISEHCSQVVQGAGGTKLAELVNKMEELITERKLCKN